LRRETLGRPAARQRPAIAAGLPIGNDEKRDRIAMEHREIISWLRENDSTRLDELWRMADAVRRRYVGDAVHLRGLIELSNHCVRTCLYCGLRQPNPRVNRYRMSADEVMACGRQAVSLGYGTVVLQSGEDFGVRAGWMATLIRRIKAESELAVTLSLGERTAEELASWREAGADRYLLRFETSNRSLYERIHPPRSGQARSDRLGLLGTLRQLGYEVGGGVMIGLSGQTYDDLARDVALFARLDLDMIGSGPYLEHPDTPMSDRKSFPPAPDRDQVPATEEMTYKVVALSRLVCPRANIPTTTALATLNSRSGRERGLARGANVIMPNVTPWPYRQWYAIYPDKACIHETAADWHAGLRRRIEAVGRAVGCGRGDSPNYLRRRAAAAGV
jgi:biotin synthase